MVTVRHLNSLVLTAALAVTMPAAAAGPSPTERIVAGEASQSGAAVVAGDHGVTYELKGGVVLTLAPGAEFSFDSPLHMKLGKPGDPAALVRPVKVSKGWAEVSIPEKASNQLAVLFRNSSKLSALIKEGHGAFVAEGNRTTAASRDGEQLVGVGNDWKTLKGGLARTLAPEDPTALPRQLLAAPAPQASRALVLLREGESGLIDARWTTVTGATKYTVDLFRVDGGKRELVASHVTNGANASLGPVKPGSYSVAVRAIDKYGLASAAASAPPARVVGLGVPEGASVSTDGTVILGRDQRVSLIGADGVEVSYGTSKMFIAAPPTLGVARNAMTVARLRASGSTDEVLVRLAPKALRARVNITPRVAMWPADKVTVEVELYDESGREVPSDLSLETNVTVNLTPTKLTWEKNGKKLRATLPTGSSPGPWIVRVEVKDSRGELLGYDFLEVAPTVKQQGALSAVAHR